MYDTRIDNKENKTRELNRNRLVLAACMIIHLLFCFLFFWGKITTLLLYNIVSVVFYFIGSWHLKKYEYTTFWLVSSCVEVFLHVILCNLLIGWQYGYSIYIIVLIPIAYYTSYMSSKAEKSMELSMTVSVLAFFVLLFSVVFSGKANHIAHASSTYVAVTFIANFIIGIAVITFFSMLFIQEIQNSTVILREQNKELHFLANYDVLTKLRNRRSMNNVFMQYEQEEDEYCVIMGDIDDFKKVNDTYSHDCGDLVLASVAEVLNLTVGKKGIVCRWGGEEILLLIKTNFQDGVALTEKLRKNIEGKHVVYEKNAIRISMTFGVAYCNERNGIEDLIALADARLYYGKRHGKNQVVYKDNDK